MLSKIASCIVDIANRLDNKGHHKTSDQLTDVLVKLAQADKFWMGEGAQNIATGWGQNVVPVQPGGLFEDESGAYNMFPYKVPKMSSDPQTMMRQMQQMYKQMAPAYQKMSQFEKGRIYLLLSQKVGPEMAKQFMEYSKTQPWASQYVQGQPYMPYVQEPYMQNNPQ